ncbi:hypothetical protein PSMEN_11595 [Ectopseudomonas mendocina]|nr:hypothetical protein PSMEN_11535 [Pseudomonas mendocina]ARS49008.1 hypothetical protein PSMEN_11595 [Pseudomonas mendocina]
MIVLDRVLCDCCGDDMGQLLGGEVVRPGALVDQSKAPHFAVCPDCYSDAAEYLGLQASQEAA